MKKRILVAIAIVVGIVLLFPRIYHLKDGGSVVYEAVLYRVENVHSLNSVNAPNMYLEGIRVEILGFEIYDNVR